MGYQLFVHVPSCKKIS